MPTQRDAKQKALTADRLWLLLAYDPETGIFRWRAGGPGHKRGAVAGSKNAFGYWRITIDRREYMAHRLAWLYVCGEWPSGDLDHRNADRADNRIANLRESERWQNSANIDRRNPNRNGFRGISRRGKKWVAKIEHKGCPLHLGTFADPATAHAAYRDACNRLRGEFAPGPDPLPPRRIGVALEAIERPALTRARLRELLDYDPATGAFIWKIETGIPGRRIAPGTVAGKINDSGYRVIGLDGRAYRASHLAVLYVRGHLPTMKVDHRNGIRSDDRIENLREASNAENAQNTAGWARRKSRLKGAYSTPNGRWRSVITVERRSIHLGTFETEAQAAAAYADAARQHFGDFARHD